MPATTTDSNGRVRAEEDPSGLDGIPKEALDRETTPFDYIIVGTGAAGAPLAARLAQAGKRILVLEAGVDPGAREPEEGWPSDSARREEENRHAIFHCPGYHGAASEPELYRSTPPDSCSSWHFDIRHYENPKTQQEDQKIQSKSNPTIFYPRNSSIGGCTSHNSMITIYGSDYDWERIETLTGDPSFAPKKMRYYFRRLERARYTRNRFTRFGEAIDRFRNWVDPKRLSDAGHGMGGWLDVTTSDPKTAGPEMIKTITKAVEVADLGGFGKLWRAAKRLFRGDLYQDLDPNDERTMRDSPEGAALVPVSSGRGMRGGPRDFLLETRRENRERLKIATGIFVKRVVFEKPPESGPPIAVGVEYVRGRDLYEASRPGKDGGRHAAGKPEICYARREIILCGGAFNTPQLLMLSGVGDPGHLADKNIPGPRDAAGNPVAEIVALEGVGSNLRDRYEVSVITRMDAKFEMLKGLNFDPDRGGEDRARRQWEDVRSRVDPVDGKKKDFRGGVYSTNGASIAILKKSRPELTRPDLFLFGFPAAFRGYYPGWSKDMLSAEKGEADADPCRSLWTWAILKAYSRNRGWVRLNSSDPFEAPFIDFNYFAEKGSEADRESAEEDLDAVVEGVRYARRLNRTTKDLPNDHSTDLQEIQPGPERTAESGNDSDLRRWIRTQAWGHHACGTCRIGSDSWQADTGKLNDKGSVIDSKFRVHGVSGLRIVDASVFPEIPGYFIVTPTYMIGEKAADTLLKPDAIYPDQLKNAEAAALAERREKAFPRADSQDRAGTTVRGDSLPADSVGLAFSGGGIRSATFCLGILQGLAARDRLRQIDFLSSISGGGYIASFLGRLFTREEVAREPDPVKKVQDILRDDTSPPIRWLRSTANYLMGAGGVDARQIYGIVLRNLFTIHLILYLAGLAVFGILSGIAEKIPASLGKPPFIGAVENLSPYWWLPPFLLAFWVLPAVLAYWLAPKPGTRGVISFFPVFGALTGLAGLIVLAGQPGGLLPAIGIGAILVVALILMEHSRPAQGEVGEPTGTGAAMRNRLSLNLSSGLFLSLGAALWVLLDSAGRALSSGVIVSILAGVWAVIMPILPLTRSLLTKAAKSPNIIIVPIAFGLAAILVVLAIGSVHWIFGLGGDWGIILTVTALLVSWILGANIAFANASSLLTAYSARLARTFLGASNPARIHAERHERTRDVRLVHPGDDIAFHEYHPERHGGPLHLIGVCVNETVDLASQRDIPDRKGMLMTVSPCGLTVGRYHGVWRKPAGKLPLNVRITNSLDGSIHDPEARTAIEGIPVPGQEFHVLRGKGNAPVPVEPLSLRTWIGISGAAFTTGSGRNTKSAMSLLLGLANVRLGYWWDSRLEMGDRPGRVKPRLGHRLKQLPLRLARMQSLLFSELRSRFPGPGQRFWYLSDGGHFDITGIYELIRRRVPLVIAVGAGTGGIDDAADFIRQVRLDFGAEIDFLKPQSDSGETGWDRRPEEKIPETVKGWVQPEALGALEEVRRRDGPRAALARVRYRDGTPRETWLILMKPSLTGDESLDLSIYGEQHSDFPTESTLDQFFDEAQWESYRKLGEVTAREVLLAKAECGEG